VKKTLPVAFLMLLAGVSLMLVFREENQRQEIQPHNPVAVSPYVAPVAPEATISVQQHSPISGPATHASPRNGHPLASPAKHDAAMRAYLQTPLDFEANRGQSPPEIGYISRGPGYVLGLSPGVARLSLQLPEQNPKAMMISSRVGVSEPRFRFSQMQLRLAGANPAAVTVGEDQERGQSNYFIGENPEKWQRAVPHFRRVKMTGVYPGIDLTFYGNPQELEYDFTLAPNANPLAIRWKIDGAQRIWIDKTGNVVLHTKAGDVQLRRPTSYQEVAGSRISVSSRFELDGKTLKFSLGNYDHSKALVIDPVLTLSLSLGSTDGLRGTSINSVEMDAAGNLYMAGYTGGSDFPSTVGPFQTDHANPIASQGTMGFIIKMDPAASTLLYSDFIGGSTGASSMWYVAPDATGNVFATGYTTSTDYPLVNNIGKTSALGSCGLSRTSSVICPDGVVFKLSADGSSLLFSSLLGGSQSTLGNVVQINPVSNEVVVLGDTDSSDFLPAPTTLQKTLSAAVCTSSKAPCFGSFLLGLDPTSGAVRYGTFIGSAGNTFANSLQLDNAGKIYLKGNTSAPLSSSFGAVTHTFAPAGGAVHAGTDIFALRLAVSAQNALSVDYQTLVQGDADSSALSDTIDATGNSYFIGSTAAKHLPVTTGVFQATYKSTASSACPWNPNVAAFLPSSCGTGFVGKLDTTGALSFLTYLGGSGGEVGSAIAQSTDGHLWLGGVTSSADFPFSSDAFLNPASDAPLSSVPFLAEMTSDGKTLPYATAIAGNFGFVLNITADDSDNVFVSGTASSVPVTPGVYPSNPGTFSPAFVQKWNSAGQAPILQLSATVLTFADAPVGSATAPQTVTVSNTGPGAMELAIQLTQGSLLFTPNDFLESNNCPTSLPASAICTISVTFEPGVRSPLCTPNTACGSTAQITVNSNAPGGPRAISLLGNSGTGATVQVSPNPIAFQGQAAGTASDSIAAEVSNNGDLALTISNVAITGTNAADFSFSLTPTDGAPSCTKVLGSGGNTCEIDVTFNPAAGATGVRTANLVLTDTGIGSPHSFPISGIVAGSTLNISPTSILMGSQGVVGTGNNTTGGFTIKNPGTTSQQVSAITVSGPNASEFTATNGNCPSAPPFTLAAGVTCFYDLAFTSSGTKGVQTATVTISGPGLTNVPTVALSTNVVGAADPAIAVISVPNPQDFGAALVDQTTGPSTHLLSISNVPPIPCPGGASSCGGPLTISSITAASSEYTVSSQGGQPYCTAPPLTIPSGDFGCSFQLFFTPNAAGNRNSTLNILSNDPRGTLSLPLLGTGTALPIAVLAPSTLNFGNSQIGVASPVQTVTLTNAGKAALGATTVIASANFAVVANNCNQSLAVGASCTIAASFTPPAAGSFNGVLTLSNNATFGGKQTVTLTGAGDSGALLLVSPALLNFADQPAGITSLPQTVTLTNTGNVAVTLPGNAIRVTEAYAVSSNTCGSGLAVGASCKLGITYTPPASGNPMGGTLLISDNAKGSPQPVYFSGFSPLNGAHASTTTVTSSANPVAAGQPVTFTAAVTSSFVGPAPTGTIFFVDGTTTIGTAMLDATAHATFTTSSLAGGTHAISAVYGSNGLYLQSNSATISQVVTGGAAPAATTTVVTSSLNPSTVGTSVTFTASVSSTVVGTITGTVTFKDGTTTLGTGTVSAGTTTFSTSSLTQGSHSITAVYGGDTNFATSTSTAVSQVVNASTKAATTTVVTSSKNPSTTGQSITFTATVSSSTAGAISGSVTFLDGATTLGTGPVGTGGVATFTTTSLTAASHSITAVYGGDTNFAGSTSPALTQVVNAGAKAATTTALTSAPNPSTNGQSVTFTATTTSTTVGTITGTTTFLDGATTLGTGPVGTNGVAAFSITSLSTATHSITAQYAGDGNFSASTSTVFTQTVNAPAPDFSVSAAPTSLVVSSSQPGVITFSVAPLNGSTQTVAFSCGNVPTNVSCSFSVPSVTLDGKTTATSKAMIQVAATGATPTLPVPPSTTLRLLTRCLSIGLVIWAILMALRIVSHGNYPRRPNLAGVFALLLLVFALASCNGGSSKGTTSTINLTATSGATAHSATVTITVR